MADAVALRLPFTGRWAVQNSPARRVPSHGADVFGQRYAIDFVAVDERGRSARRRDWRTLLATEAPERFVGFGAPILAPCDGVVAAVRDGEVDHAARRSQLTLVPYALGQAGRLRRGAAALAGNHVVLRHGSGRAWVVLAHLRSGSLRVRPGDEVCAGQQVAACGNSGNSTEPHVHVQVSDAADLTVAAGVPVTFERYREWDRRQRTFVDRASGVPAEGAVVEPLPARQNRA